VSRGYRGTCNLCRANATLPRSQDFPAAATYRLSSQQTMSRLALCHGDPLLALLRDVFDATPLRVPEERVTVLSAIATKGKQSRFLGAFDALLESGSPLLLPNKVSHVASLANRQSRSIKADLALKILEGFLVPFGFPTPSISGAWATADEVSFSFPSVHRRYVELAVLGKHLATLKLDTSNTLSSMLRPRGEWDLLVIDSVLQTSQFIVEITHASTRTIHLSATQLVESLGASSPAVTVRSEREVVFAAPTALTFAFSCVRLCSDAEGGLVGIEPDHASSRGFDAQPGDAATAERVLVAGEGELLGWD
jgi:hypothetical protein